ncbi:MAG: type II toxin-antitoxin system VapC family toxin [Hyphomicrobiaceae bacterium]
MGRQRALMGALLDTHALIWWVEGDDRITARLRQLLGSPQEDVFVSAATAWEIATKVRIGKLQLAEEFLQNFLDAVEALGFRPLPISLRHGYEAGRLPGPHRDPFDRMLAAQALAEDLVLVSADPAFNALGVSTFW